MDKLNYQQGMALLAATYQREIAKPTFEAYWRILGDLSDDEWAHAVKTVTATETRWPHPATIRKAVGSSGSTQTEGSRGEVMSGSGGTDPGRPIRIGEYQAQAHIDEDWPRHGYYDAMIRHMSHDDQAQAVRARDDLLDAYFRQPADDGASRGMGSVLGECRRLKLIHDKGDE